MNKEISNKRERIIILIDGSNFYYSTAKKGKKIDFKTLIEELAKDRDLVRTYYFVAPLDIKSNEERYWSHQRFLNVLSQIPRFEVVLCTLKKIKVGGKYAYFVKGDDVKMSNTLIMGAVDNSYDIAIVVSGDEDFLDSIKIVRERYGKKVGNAYFSKSSSSNLRGICDFTINLDAIINKMEMKRSSVLS